MQNGIQISSNSEWDFFDSIAEAICNICSGKIIEKVDGFDQRYWDISISGNIFTLHLEHYLGISFYIKDLVSEENAIETFGKVEEAAKKEIEKHEANI